MRYCLSLLLLREEKKREELLMGPGVGLKLHLKAGQEECLYYIIHDYHHDTSFQYCI